MKEKYVISITDEKPTVNIMYTCIKIMNVLLIYSLSFSSTTKIS